MKYNRNELSFAILLVALGLSYIYFEYKMHNSLSGLGLGAYLIYLGVLLFHGGILVVSYIAKRLNKIGEGRFFFGLNIIIVLLLLIRLLAVFYPDFEY
jgi:hypothetical protein